MIYHIKFEVSLHFFGIRPTVRRRLPRGPMATTTRAPRAAIRYRQSRCAPQFYRAFPFPSLLVAAVQLSRVSKPPTEGHFTVSVTMSHQRYSKLVFGIIDSFSPFPIPTGLLPSHCFWCQCYIRHSTLTTVSKSSQPVYSLKNYVKNLQVYLNFTCKHQINWKIPSNFCCLLRIYDPSSSHKIC